MMDAEFVVTQKLQPLKLLNAQIVKIFVIARIRSLFQSLQLP